MVPSYFKIEILASRLYLMLMSIIFSVTVGIIEIHVYISASL